MHSTPPKARRNAQLLLPSGSVTLPAESLDNTGVKLMSAGLPLIGQPTPQPGRNLPPSRGARDQCGTGNRSQQPDDERGVAPCREPQCHGRGENEPMLPRKPRAGLVVFLELVQCVVSHRFYFR